MLGKSIYMRAFSSDNKKPSAETPKSKAKRTSAKGAKGASNIMTAFMQKNCC